MPRVWVWSSVGVDFTNQTSISNSKCYPDLEPTGRTECKWLTLFLSELPLQIPVTPWGCQNKLNALYTKSWGHFFFNLKLSCCWEYLHLPWDSGHILCLPRISVPECSTTENCDISSLFYVLPSVTLRGQENTPFWKFLMQFLFWLSIISSKFLWCKWFFSIDFPYISMDPQLSAPCIF